MHLGKDLTGNPVISITDGRSVGRVRDFFLTPNCDQVAGLYLGTEGIFSRQSFIVKADDIVAIGPDATLVKHDEVVHEAGEIEGSESWPRRDVLQGRPVDTPGGTKVGKIGDIIIDKDGRVAGFSLSSVYVSGPVADNRAVAMHAVQDMGTEDGAMTVDLEQAEQQRLAIE